MVCETGGPRGSQWLGFQFGKISSGPFMGACFLATAQHFNVRQKLFALAALFAARAVMPSALHDSALAGFHAVLLQPPSMQAAVHALMTGVTREPDSEPREHPRQHPHEHEHPRALSDISQQPREQSCEIICEHPRERAQELPRQHPRLHPRLRPRGSPYTLQKPERDDLRQCALQAVLPQPPGPGTQAALMPEVPREAPCAPQQPERDDLRQSAQQASTALEEARQVLEQEYTSELEGALPSARADVAQLGQFCLQDARREACGVTKPKVERLRHTEAEKVAEFGEMHARSKAEVQWLCKLSEVREASTLAQLTEAETHSEEHEMAKLAHAKKHQVQLARLRLECACSIVGAQMRNVEHEEPMLLQAQEQQVELARLRFECARTIDEAQTRNAEHEKACLAKTERHEVELAQHRLECARATEEMVAGRAEARMAGAQLAEACEELVQVRRCIANARAEAEASHELAELRGSEIVAERLRVTRARAAAAAAAAAAVAALAVDAPGTARADEGIDDDDRGVAGMGDEELAKRLRLNERASKAHARVEAAAAVRTWTSAPAFVPKKEEAIDSDGDSL
eukprot:NODE_2976_length_2112_cov_9.588917.p1 GENE.NODE_2976_length_2112_cov_9.588917~~NODE_2976_length_2112_cov_9.588917.p1  ORF type:complete len:627 (+),score=163.63 NODE_2976_length_2112_cov_9.588917:157-1881(+)